MMYLEMPQYRPLQQKQNRQNKNLLSSTSYHSHPIFYRMFAAMSEKRTLLSRPRTRVYDCNYNAGERYYKPMVDQLDRKYSGTSSLPSASFSTPTFTSRIKDDDDFPLPRRSSPFSTSSDYESLSERRSRLNGESRSLENDLEDEIVSSMKKLKVLRAAKAASVEEELSPPTSILNGLPKHKRLVFAKKHVHFAE